MLPSFLTRDKWVDLDPNIFPDAIPNVRWRFGDQEGTYSTGVSRMCCACLLQPIQCLCPSLT